LTSTRIPALVSPDVVYRESYRGLVAEFLEKGEKPVPFVLSFEHVDFDGMLARLVDCSRGIGLPTGFVPHTTYWLVDQRNNVVGVSNIRHALTPALHREGGNIGYGVRPSARGRGLGTELLRQSLLRARDIGLDKALLTCGKTNYASVKVILSNGGVLESEEFLPDRAEVVQRYSIQIPLRPF
jgi:predicted acetyltransferase